ncbi:MAG: hypothetical protein H0Z39_08400 [Peptococcaceae bacterium]|nr:hypothetical protein [Peptococcaceae bacterium]
MNTALPPEIEEILRQIREFIPTLSAAAGEVTTLLQQGDVAQGMRGLGELVNGLKELQRVLEFLCSSFSVELSGLESSRVQIEAVYPSLLTAVEDADPVAISDVLSYELVPALESCQGGLQRG